MDRGARAEGMADRDGRISDRLRSCLFRLWDVLIMLYVVIVRRLNPEIRRAGHAPYSRLPRSAALKVHVVHKIRIKISSKKSRPDPQA